MWRFVSLIRPGQASNLIPKLGTAQLCKTSVDVISADIFVLIGKVRMLSTVKRRFA
jgi:hypothetical protein